MPFAVDRARECGLGSFDYGDVVVIGDTPSDVACAVAVGAQPVAVATGNYTIDQLRATGAPIVLDDLSDVEGFLRMLELRRQQLAVGSATPARGLRDSGPEIRAARGSGLGSVGSGLSDRRTVGWRRVAEAPGSRTQPARNAGGDRF